jgi:CelD/BcsL family acetyltransferase involved in cellulose biosynthesis
MEGTETFLRWRLLPVEHFGEIAHHWQRVVLKRSMAPFLQVEFIEPLLRHFAKGGEEIAIGEQQGGISALAILAPPSRGRRNTFQPSQLPLGPIVLDDNLAIETALETLTRQLPITALSVGFTQLDSAMYPRPKATATLSVNDYIQTAWVDVEGNFADYWEARGKNLRKNIRRQRRKLLDDGVDVRLEVLRDSASVADAIDNYGMLESSGWKASGGTAIHSSNAQGRFYREMLERFCANGRGCIYLYHFYGLLTG